MQYRKEIDGLRAIAVLSVIFHHAGFQSFSGGFVGVDIFFVISGYLISSIIIEEKMKGTFRLADFYERRIRRILPALFFVMLVCLPFAWLWMQPEALKAFSKSIVAISLFSSNILFWKESGYYIPASNLIPLMPTWSLGIEEQYYVIFPLFLMLIWSLGKKKMHCLFAILAISSLFLANWGAHHNPFANFFLLPSRAWEFLLGSFCAFYLLNNTKKTPVFISQILSIAGLFFIWVSASGFNYTLKYPGFWTLIPTLGAASIILFATPNTWVCKLLCKPFFVGIGMISYSAYLWHQPLFVFARLRSPEPPNLYIYLILSILSLILAFFTWKYIEQPFRKPNPESKQYPFVIAAIFSTLFIILGAINT